MVSLSLTRTKPDYSTALKRFQPELPPNFFSTITARHVQLSGDFGPFASGQLKSISKAKTAGKPCRTVAAATAAGSSTGKSPNNLLVLMPREWFLKPLRQAMRTLVRPCTNLTRRKQLMIKKPLPRRCFEDLMAGFAEGDIANLTQTLPHHKEAGAYVAHLQRDALQLRAQQGQADQTIVGAARTRAVPAAFACPWRS
eukprot:6201151-Pleurochrysis_carterae.AAC.1